MVEEYNPVRVFSFCPRCGAPGLEAGSVRSVKCLSCHFEFYFNMAAAVAGLIFDEDGRLLLTRRAHDPVKGTLDLPGGFIDMGETAEQALKREIREELNIGIEILSLFGTYPNTYLFGGVLYETLDLVYLCKSVELKEIKASDDVSGFEFRFTETVAEEEIGLSSVRKIIKDLNLSKIRS